MVGVRRVIPLQAVLSGNRYKVDSMKIYVCVKHVPDSAANIALDDDRHINEKVTFLLNPYDEYAVTEAVALKERIMKGDDPVAEVVVVSLGKEDAEKTLRSAMAMGADRGIHVTTDKIEDSQTTARALEAAIRRDGEPGIIFTGRESIDMEGMQTPFRLAEYFGFPVATNVVEFSPNIEKGEVTVASMTEASGRDIYVLTLPCVIGAGRGLNTPSYPTFPDVVKARKKPIEAIAMDQLPFRLPASSTKIVKLELFSEKRKAREITGDLAQKVDTLVNILKEEAKVIQ